jgi:polysaccharide biosynthesis protein PslG
MASKIDRRLLLIWCCTVAAVGMVRAADEPARLPGPAIPDGLGVNIHFTDPRPGELEMLAAGGFRFVRMDFTWSSIERKPAEYDFSAYDRLLAALDQHQIRAVLILDYGNPLYDNSEAPRTDAGRAAFVRWAVAGISHFRGRGAIWEMWNEPNIGFWKPNPDAAAYAKLAVAVGKGIRETPAIARELYVGPAMSTIDLKFLEICLKQGCLNYWDAVSVHPYRQDAPMIGRKAAHDSDKLEFNHAGDPETALADYAKIRDLIAKHAHAKKSVPILSGEWGYAVGAQARGGWRAYDAERQGKMLARQWLVNLSAGVPLSIWYDWHDDGTNPAEPEHHFGTVENEYHADRTPVYQPKPAYIAAQTLTKTLSGYQLERIMKHGQDNDYELQFHNGSRRAWAAWTTREPKKTRLSIPAGRYTIVSYLGKASEATAGASGLPLELSEAVQYVLPR